MSKNKKRSFFQQTICQGVVLRQGDNYYFSPDDEEGEKYHILPEDMLMALEGDRVSAAVSYNRRRNRQEVKVMEVISRAKDTFVGTLSFNKNYAFLLTRGRYLPWDIFIPKSELHHAQDGHKAVVQITQWPTAFGQSPVGRVVDLLGSAGDNNAEMHAILCEFGLPYAYPAKLEKLANKISDKISADEIKAREDFRSITTFTIDPRDAKDFDDALSIRKMPDGLWEIGVHIADVTYYIKEGSSIDEEAYQRATSVYLVDRTIPMLPERLCNYICSLRPKEDKLAYSVIFLMDDLAEVKESRIVRTVIRSDRRFMYEEVQAILEQNGEASEEDLLQPGFHPQRIEPQADGCPVGEFAQELITLNRLAKLLKRQRTKDGAIEFHRDEVHFEIDEKGHPISTYLKVSQDAHKLIEEFMLLANRYVAQKIGQVPSGQKAKTFPYRIHDVPDSEKMERLSAYVERFGLSLRTDGSKKDVASGINRLLRQAQGRKEQALIEDFALRSMMKARYSVHNIGHYGLMFRYYTHFTSPIRRYPDQMVHRLLTRYLNGGRSVNKEKCEEQCEHSSQMEQIAANAERASIKYKQVEFLSDKIGQEFDGKICNLTDFALYVELAENHCEGAVPLRTIKGDYYYFDERSLTVQGRRRHHRIQLGDQVRIKVLGANLDRRQLAFELIEINGHRL